MIAPRLGISIVHRARWMPLPTQVGHPAVRRLRSSRQIVSPPISMIPCCWASSLALAEKSSPSDTAHPSAIGFAAIVATSCFTAPSCVVPAYFLTCTRGMVSPVSKGDTSVR